MITTLTATDADNDALTFHIRGEIATSILELKKTGNKQAQVLLKTALDKEVIFGVNMFTKIGTVFYSFYNSVPPNNTYNTRYL